MLPNWTNLNASLVIFCSPFPVYKKHHPPVLEDEVWRLEKIGKEGAFHKRLNKEKIVTVKDFLTLLHLDAPRLRKVLCTLLQGLQNLLMYFIIFVEFIQAVDD